MPVVLSESVVVTGDRRGRVSPSVLVPLLIVAVLAAIWLWTRPGSLPSVDAGKAVAEKFLLTVRNGQAAEAWESTTAEFKSALGREAFQRSVASSVLLKQPLEFASTQTVTVQDQSRAEYLFHNPTLKGPTARIVIGREAGTWKVDRLIAD